MAILPFPVLSAGVTVDLKVSRTTRVKVLENTFGDGYVQRAADGLNAQRDEFAASWTNLTEIDFHVIDEFLKERAGWQAFTYKQPGDSAPKKWTCKEWSFSPVGGPWWTGRGTFSQVFDL